MLMTFSMVVASTVYVAMAAEDVAEIGCGLKRDFGQWSHRWDSLPYPPCKDMDIPLYTAYRSTSPIVIDGHLDEEIWQNVPRSASFRDLISGMNTIHQTQAAVVWDSTHLYVAFWVQEPFVEGKLTERDAPIYQDNDVELFIAGAGAYYEFEINALGTIYEVFFIWEEAFGRLGFDTIDDFRKDAELVRPFHGVGYRPHPKGPRIGYWNWDFPGLQSAVQVDGTLNDNSDRDRGWTVELALPWSGMVHLVQGSQQKLPPGHNDVWRMDFSRFNQYKEAPPATDSGGWAWSPHGVWDSHVPECFTVITFSENSWFEGIYNQD